LGDGWLRIILGSTLDSYQAESMAKRRSDTLLQVGEIVYDAICQDAIAFLVAHRPLTKE